MENHQILIVCEVAIKNFVGAWILLSQNVTLLFLLLTWMGSG